MIRSRSIVRWLTTVAVVAASAGTALAQDTPFVGRIARDSVTVRAQASAAHQRIGELTRGREVVVHRVVRDWAQIEIPSDFPIWISAKYVRLDGDIGTVTGSRVNLRPTPDTAGSVLGQAARGDQLRVVGKEGDWLQVLPPKSARGWLLKSLVEFVRGGETAAGTPKTLVADETPETRHDGPNYLEQARSAFGQALHAPVGQRDFSAAEALIAKAAASGQGGDKALQIGRMIAEAKAKDGEYTNALAEVRARFEKENAELAALLKRIQDRVKQIGETKPVEPFTAVGTFDALGLMWNAPGTHELVNEKGVRFFLKSASLNLTRALWYGKKVGVRGQVVDMPGWGRVIEVHEIVALEPLKRKVD